MDLALAIFRNPGVKTASRVLVFLMRIFVVLTHATNDQSSPHCSSTFQVWQPGQNAQQMIREVYLKVDNITSYTKYQIAEMKTHMTQEVSKIYNWTYSVDKRVFQLQIDKMDDELVQMKFSAGTSKIHMQLEHVNRRVDDLERSMYSIRSKLRSSRSSENSRQVYDQIPQRQGISPDMGLMLKNSVGDLKAEWILLKRDVESLKKESLNLQESQLDFRNDTSSLKVSLDATTAETKKLEMKVLEIADKQNRLEVKLNKMASEDEQMRQEVIKYRAGLNEHAVTIASLQTLSTSLQKDLSILNTKMGNLNDVIPSQSHESLNYKEQPEVDLVIPVSMTEEGASFESPKEETLITTPSRIAKVPKDCHDLYEAGNRVSSVYQIQPDKARYLVPVYCEMINNTGLTLIQRRIDGTINFNKRWSEYKQGFGNPYGEIWLGNELLHKISQQRQYILRIDLWDWEGEQFYAEYSRFFVEGEKDQYKLMVGDYSGTAGDSLAYHNKMAFSTEDMDNDLHERHCAAENKGGWWYNSCFYSQLNNLYHTAWYAQTQSNYADGIVWYTLKDSEFYSLKKVEMKLKLKQKATG